MNGMDENNPIVIRCLEGTRAEFEGRKNDACALYQQAWDEAKDDYEACVAAHYMARCQDNPQDELHWNEEALKHAEALKDESVEGFFPSLYLNLGHSHELLGNLEEAQEYYRLAAGPDEEAPSLP